MALTLKINLIETNECVKEQYVNGLHFCVH